MDQNAFGSDSPLEATNKKNTPRLSDKARHSAACPALAEVRPIRDGSACDDVMRHTLSLLTYLHHADAPAGRCHGQSARNVALYVIVGQVEVALSRTMTPMGK